MINETILNKAINKSNTFLLTQLANFTMINFGFIASIQGATFVSAMQYLQVSPIYMGNMMALNALGFLVTRLFGGILADLFKRKQIVLIGAIITAISLFLFGRNTNYLFNVILMFTMGLGNALWFGTINAIIMDLYQKNLGPAMNKLHSFFTIGAILGPVVAVLISKYSLQWQLNYKLASLGMVIFIISWCFLKFQEKSKEERVTLKEIKQILTYPNLQLLSLIALFYVGIEVGITLWIGSYLQKVHNLNEQLSNYALSIYWLGQGIGRLLLSYILHHLNYAPLMYGLLGGIILSLSLMLILSGKYLLLLLFGLTGLFCSGMYPTLMAIGGKWFPRFSGSISGAISFGASAGAMLIPLIMSVIVQKYNLHTGMSFYTIMAIVSLLLLIYTFRRYAPTEDEKT